jgi:hypothetical protein
MIPSANIFFNRPEKTHGTPCRRYPNQLMGQDEQFALSSPNIWAVMTVARAPNRDQQAMEALHECGGLELNLGVAA